MGETDSAIQGFYKHSNSKKEIGWKDSIDKDTVGPNLAQAIQVLEDAGLDERANIYAKEGGWSGDLYVAHRKLIKFQDEIIRFVGDSGAGGPLVANVYEVVMNSTQGWAQYLSIILKGPFDGKIAKKLDLDFAPKHSYLAKNDSVPDTTSKKRLWLDNLIEFEHILLR